MHKRRQILEALRTQLLAVPYFSGVWIKRVTTAAAQFPHVILYADSETIETESIHTPARPQDRTLTVNVVAWIRGSVDDERSEIDMDTAATAIEEGVTRPTMADDILLTGTEFTVDEDDPQTNAVTLTYQVSYMTTENSPEL